MTSSAGEIYFCNLFIFTSVSNLYNSHYFSTVGVFCQGEAFQGADSLGAGVGAGVGIGAGAGVGDREGA